MNKSELVNDVAASASLSKADAAKAVEAILANVTNVLAKGDSVRIAGFGTFAVTAREATTGRNPRTGEAIELPASRQPKFKAGKTLKERVEG